MKERIKNFTSDKIKLMAVILAIIVIVVAVVLVITITGKDDVQTMDPAAIIGPVADIKADVSVSGISVTSVDTIAGMYVEDGTNDVLTDIFTVTFTNDSDKALQYAKLVLSVGEEDYVFEISTIPAGASVRAMEMNRKTLVPTKGEVTLNQENIVWFNDELSLAEGLLEITPTDNGIAVKNVSGSAINAPLYVYYKNYVDDMYVGGITYRAGTQENLEPGQTVMLSAKHIDVDTSKLMFVTYGA